MSRITITAFALLFALALCLSALAQGPYERRAIPDGASGSRRSAPPPPPGISAGQGVYIERVHPNVAFPGDGLQIRGSHFGADQGSKIVAINLGRVHRMRVVRWSNNQIRALIPDRLRPGEYRVLIYYDDSFRTSSNSLVVTIERRPRR